VTGGGWAGRRLIGPDRGSDRGSVTAELAVGLPAVVVLLVAVLGVGTAGVQHMRCAEAARTAARVAALGEADAEVVAAGERVAGEGADVRVARADGWATVTVVVALPVAGLGDLVTLESQATAWVEP
jgi:hypothetical protein